MEPVSLSIGQVREEIRRATGQDSTGKGAPSSPLAGRIFHDVFAALLGSDPNLRWQAAIAPEHLGDRKLLLEHVYLKLLGPKLTEFQAQLQEQGAEILNLWHATRQLTDWIASLIESAYRRQILKFDRTTQTWSGDDSLCIAEQPVSWTFREDGWTRPVQITGIPDVVWRNPKTGRWCLVEYKLGKTNPEADLAQACLYHFILASGGFVDQASVGAMAVVSFLPDLEERFIEPEKLAAAQIELRALIGRMAGVLPSQVRSELLLSAPAPDPEHGELGHRLVKALEQYGPVVELRGSPIAGPTFLRYTIMPGKGVRVSSIIGRANDLQIQLGLENPPMIQKAGGKLVIDVQRPDRETVLFSKIRTQLPPRDDAASRAKIPLGVDLFGQLQFADLAKTPHLLVAGTSGSGKTEWLRTALAGMLCVNTPQTLRLVLIDPKRNAFGELKYSPFLMTPDSVVYPPESSAVTMLDRLIEEMEERYKLLQAAQSADLAEYNAKSDAPRPRILCVCDEYADLVAVRKEKKQIEERIRRLGAKARAAGIHLIIATQYPRADIVDGALKANLPGRVCLRLTSHTQSNLVIGQSGAERLLGNGDLFWADIGEPVRLQAPLLTPDERVNILGWMPALLEAAGAR